MRLLLHTRGRLAITLFPYIWIALGGDGFTDRFHAEFDIAVPRSKANTYICNTFH